MGNSKYPDMRVGRIAIKTRDIFGCNVFDNQVRLGSCTRLIVCYIEVIIISFSCCKASGGTVSFGNHPEEQRPEPDLESQGTRRP